MSGAAAWSEAGRSWPLPALLRGARATFGSVIRRELAAVGYDDIPPNGLFVLGAIAPDGTPLADIITALRVSKQTAGALVDSLVVRGYVDRRADAVDRRRLMVALTGRGEEAAAVIHNVGTGIEAALEAAVGTNVVVNLRLALAALASMGEAHD